MKKQVIITGAVLMGLVFLFSGNAWAARERPGGRGDGDGQHFRDRGDHRPDRATKPDHGRQWRGREGEKARKPQDRRWRHRKSHTGPQQHWQQPRKHNRGHRWRPGRHHGPYRYRRPAHHRRGPGRHHAWQPVLEKRVYHYYEQAESDAAPAEQFEIAARIDDPAGVSFSFGVSGSGSN